MTWGRWGEKNSPQTMLLGEYSVRTGKTPQQHKSTYTIDTHSHRGSESGPASSHPVPQPLIRRWSDPPDRPADPSERRRVVEGGAMSVMSVGWGEERKSVSLHCSPGVDCNNSLAKATVWGSQKKIRLFFSLGRVNIPILQATLCPFWSPYNHFSFKAVNFSLVESILRL